MGAGNLVLAGTTGVQSGGQYRLQSNSGIQPAGARAVSWRSSRRALNKTGGTGVSTVTSTLNNGGVIQVLRHAQAHRARSVRSPAPRSTGSWIARHSDHLVHADDRHGSAFNTIGAARVTLNGANSAFTNLSGLNTVNGNFFVVRPVVHDGQPDQQRPVTLGPGSKLNVNGNYTQTGSGVYVTRLGGTNSRPTMGSIVVKGTVHLAGALSVQNMSNLKPILGSTFTIIANQGPSTIQGIFNGLPQGSPINVSGMLFTIAYTAGANGRNVGLTRTQ